MRCLLALTAALVLLGCAGGREEAEPETVAGVVPPATSAVEDIPASSSVAEDAPPPTSIGENALPDVTEVSPFGVVLAFQTDEPVRAQVEYGLPGRLGLFSAVDPAPTRSHRVLLDGLSPERGWDYRVFIEGAPSASGTFETNSLPDRPLRVSAAGSRLEIEGNAFFPIMQIGQCLDGYAKSRALGVDVFVGREQHCDVDDEELVDAAQAIGALAVVHFEDGIPGRAGLLGYNLRDEPDSLGFPPEAVAAEHDQAHAADPEHPTFITLSQSLHPDFEARWSGAEREAVYRAYANAADVVGVDLYPYWTLCDGSYLPAVAAAQRVLSEYAEGPTFQWIEAAAANNTACTGTRAAPVSADEMRAEVWMAVASGAGGIGYFTHTWVNGHVAFDVTPDLREAIRETNDELKGLSAALLGEAAEVSVSAPGVDAIARARNGALYVVAVNETRETMAVRFALPVGDRPVLNWRSSAPLTADVDGFADTLEPLASAIYVLPPTPSTS